jgi:hypothetical protein
MKITLESTTKVTALNGVECRLWEGETAAGVKCSALIPLIMAKSDSDLVEFERELREKIPPSPFCDWLPDRMET